MLEEIRKNQFLSANMEKDHDLFLKLFIIVCEEDQDLEKMNPLNKSIQVAVNYLNLKREKEILMCRKLDD